MSDGSFAIKRFKTKGFCIHRISQTKRDDVVESHVKLVWKDRFVRTLIPLDEFLWCLLCLIQNCRVPHVRGF